MNRNNLPWVRDWEEQVERDTRCLVRSVLGMIVFIVLMMVMSWMFADGLDRTAALAEAQARGSRLGRLELLQRVDRELDREATVWQAFYRAASRPGMSGFDGVVLVENKP